MVEIKHNTDYYVSQNYCKTCDYWREKRKWCVRYSFTITHDMASAPRRCSGHPKAERRLRDTLKDFIPASHL